MKKTNPIVNLILMLFVTTFMISGCKFFSSTKLKSPVISLNETAQTLTWDTDYNAIKYEIYMNESKVDEVENDSDRTQYSYNYSEVIGEFGEFRFQVKSIAKEDYVDSDLSNAVVVVVGNAIDYLDKNLSDLNYSFRAEYVPTNVTVVGNTLGWSAPTSGSNLTKYNVSIYTNTNGVEVYETTDTTLLIDDTMKRGSDVLAIKVSAVIGGVNYASDTLYYYNPIDNDKYGVYTDTIYTFDGQVYDYFIENWSELQNLYHYAFIYRIESLNFMVKESFYEEYSDTYFDTSYLSDYKADNYIESYAYYETYGFVNPPHLRSISAPHGVDDKCFNLSCKFLTKECSLTGTGISSPARTQDKIYEPYYNMVDYEKRSDSYDNFASDDYYLTSEVDTSEELFWAVSTHIKPVFTNNTSRAYMIYEKAKEVLREIICDDMTEYEKVLSIFDYIMTTTTYDYNAYGNGSSNPMEYACYYLEAIFLNPNKLSVCDGYSKTFALLCNMEGINCVRIVGTAGVTAQGGHAWNKVVVDGKWYVVDLTWTELEGNSDGKIHYRPQYGCVAFDNGEPVYGYYAEAYLNIDQEESCHAYFLISDEQIRYTHRDFENRFLYSILKAPESYEYYESTYITTENGEITRYVSTIEELADILEHALVHDGSGVEVVINTDLFYQYGNDIIEILIAARESFCAVSYFTNLVVVDRITENEVVVGGTTFRYSTGVSYAGFEYNSENEMGIYLLIAPSVSLTTDARLTDYIDFVVENRHEKNTEVTLSKDKINEWIAPIAGNIASLSDNQRIEYLETYFTQLFAQKGVNIEVNITQTANYVTENVFTQSEQGDWGYQDVTTGKFTIEFVYA